MEFKQLCCYFNKLEQESGRLKKIKLLTGLIKKLEKDEIVAAIDLSLGRFGPDYNQLTLGIKENFLIKGFTTILGYDSKTVLARFHEIGDVGDLAVNLAEQGTQTGLEDFFDQPKEKFQLSIKELHQSMFKISSLEGKSSASAKINTISAINKKLSPIEKKYYYRALIGKTRLGLKQSTWIAAIAEFLESKDSKQLVENAYFFTSDLVHVAKIAVQTGLEGIKNLAKVVVGTPIHTMLAQRVGSTAEIESKLQGSYCVEPKYDGYRIQIHVTAEKNISLWSRNQESYNTQFPDIIESLSTIKHPIILEGELVAFNRTQNEILSFQILTQRSKKHGIEQAVKDINVKVFLFDILYFQGKQLTDLPYFQRREYLKKLEINQEFFEIIKSTICNTPKEIEEEIIDAKNNNLEGIMIKDTREHAIYEPGKRSFYWLKYKADYNYALIDTFDLVVIGAFAGKGKRGGKYGALLMATYDPQTENYYSFCKMSSGLSDNDLNELKKELDENKLQKKPEAYIVNILPEIWVSPQIILEISGAEISNSPIHTVKKNEKVNLALRFPRFVKRRTDKSAPHGITSVEEIVAISEIMKIGRS